MAKKRITSNSSNISQTAIAYKGTVTLKFMSGDKLIKKYTVDNSSTMRLLNSIAYFISGWPSSDKPNYMGIGRSNSTSGWDINTYKLLDEYNGLRTSVDARSVVEARDSNNILKGSMARFTAVFPFSLINSLTIGEIGLFSGKTGDNLLARITIPGDPIVVSEKLSLTIEWQLAFTNKEIVDSLNGGN